jgi:hypothetical protein
MQQSVDLGSRIEHIARYLGATYPTESFERYEDDARGIVGFRFNGSPYGNVEFERDWLTVLPSDENGIAQEMHLRHVCSEIIATAPNQRVIFAREEIRRERV